MARSNLSQVYSEGPYCGLPEFPDVKGKTAIVLGATGISGHYMLQVLARHPERWTKIYAVSRRPPQITSAANIEHRSINLLGGVESIREALKGVDADYAFFFAYKETSGDDGTLWGNQELMVRENSQMLRDFILAMDGTPLKRLVLQTGAKHYGVQIGPTTLPSKETDPRVDTTPNFYYPQEDTLRELGLKQGFDWAVVRPALIVGAVKNNYMNIAMTIGLYIAISKELGDPVIWHGTASKYYAFETFSSAFLNACLEEYCALTPACGNEAFNAANGDYATWSSVLPAAAAHFSAPMAPIEALDLPGPHPVKTVSELPAPRDPREHGVFELRNSLAEWSKETRVKEAWERLADRQGLDKEIFYSANWAFADGGPSFQHEVMLDVTKARKFGFHATVESSENFVACLKEAQNLELLPRFES